MCTDYGVLLLLVLLLLLFYIANLNAFCFGHFHDHFLFVTNLQTTYGDEPVLGF